MTDLSKAIDLLLKEKELLDIDHIRAMALNGCDCGLCQVVREVAIIQAVAERSEPSQ